MIGNRTAFSSYGSHRAPRAATVHLYRACVPIADSPPGRQHPGERAHLRQCASAVCCAPCAPQWCVHTPCFRPHNVHVNGAPLARWPTGACRRPGRRCRAAQRSSCARLLCPGRRRAGVGRQCAESRHDTGRPAPAAPPLTHHAVVQYSPRPCPHASGPAHRRSCLPTRVRTRSALLAHMRFTTLTSLAYNRQPGSPPRTSPRGRRCAASKCAPPARRLQRRRAPQRERDGGGAAAVGGAR